MPIRKIRSSHRAAATTRGTGEKAALLENMPVELLDLISSDLVSSGFRETSRDIRALRLTSKQLNAAILGSPSQRRLKARTANLRKHMRQIDDLALPCEDDNTSQRPGKRARRLFEADELGSPTNIGLRYKVVSSTFSLKSPAEQKWVLDSVEMLGVHAKAAALEAMSPFVGDLHRSNRDRPATMAAEILKSTNSGSLYHESCREQAAMTIYRSKTVVSPQCKAEIGRFFDHLPAPGQLPPLTPHSFGRSAVRWEVSDRIEWEQGPRAVKLLSNLAEDRGRREHQLSQVADIVQGAHAVTARDAMRLSERPRESGGR